MFVCACMRLYSSHILVSDIKILKRTIDYFIIKKIAAVPFPPIPGPVTLSLVLRCLILTQYL